MKKLPTYGEIVERIAERHGVNPRKVDTFLRFHLQSVGESIQFRKELNLRGLGTFKRSKRGTISKKRRETRKRMVHAYKITKYEHKLMKNKD